MFRPKVISEQLPLVQSKSTGELSFLTLLMNFGGSSGEFEDVTHME